MMGGKNGWQDDALVFVLCLPFVLCFIPGAQAFAREGFLILQHATPPWYQAGFGAALAFVFGKDRAAAVVSRLLGRRREKN